LEKLKTIYWQNAREISLFIFSFTLLSIMMCPIYFRIFISGSLLMKNKVESTIIMLFSSIIYFIISIGFLENVQILGIFLNAIFICISIYLKHKSNRDINYYHNRNIIYIISLCFLFFSDIVPNNILEALHDTFIDYGDIDSTIRILTFWVFVSIFTILQKLAKTKLFILIFSNLYFILNIINYWVYTITKQPLLISDINLIKTAGSVMEGVDIDTQSILAFLIMIMMIVIFNFIFIKFVEFKNDKLSKKNTITKITISLFVILLFFTQVSKLSTLSFSTFERYGLIGHLATNVKTLEEPTNYQVFTELKMEKITEKTNEKKPNVIVIMNEAFSDLSMVSNNFNTSTNYIPYTKSLMEKYPSGVTYSSTFGNNTVSSEFEFLTGIPTGLTTAGSIIYQQVIKDETNSIIGEFKNNGYKTIGLHPYGRNGYNRGNSWDNFGIDESYFEEYFDDSEKIRKFVSDEAFYDKIIELYENNKDTPLFIYGISMQNHATYNTEDFNKTETNFNDDVNEYITLSNTSDEALKKLIEYFKNVDEDTVILFYGDHQPMIDSSFYETLLNKSEIDFTSEEKLLKYQIPYILWSNYDLDVEVPQETSMCYLPGILLESINFKTSSWFEYTNEMKDKYPIMTELFFKEKNGELIETSIIKKNLDNITDVNSEDNLVDLKKYQCLGYEILTE